MQILQTKSFLKAVKKLHKNQKQDLDMAVKTVVENPQIGVLKKGDLAGVQVYKFSMQKQQVLLAYHFEDELLTLTLLALGTHENFYQKLKK